MKSLEDRIFHFGEILLENNKVLKYCQIYKYEIMFLKYLVFKWSKMKYQMMSFIF